MPVVGRVYGLCGMACVVLGVTIASPRHHRDNVEGQWVIDEPSSLAWWQMNPHLGDLWGTTCPSESSWHAGREQDPMRHPKTGYAAVLDTVIPLYPRPVAQSICRPAVSGEFSIADTVSWQGVRGRVIIDAFAITSDNPRRDTYARAYIFKTGSFPTIEFQVDSVTGIVRHGDTLTASAVGVFEFVGVRRAMAVPIRAWREPLGLRVTGKAEFPALELETTYNISRMALGMGVGARVWKTLHWGVDAVVVPASVGAERNN
ncbi:MAG TPA: YceI family protein [Gemmatimonadales bacterium]|nr:YceI family protein [Gemmatimonadales bacterium]